MSPSLVVTRVGDEYRVMAGTASLRFRHLTAHHDGPTAVIEALDLSIGGRPLVDRLALLSSRTRTSLARTLNARFRGLTWETILDDACFAVYEAFEQGEPSMPLTPERPDADAWLMEGLIPLNQTTVLFADGGSLKSFFALALALAGLRNEPMADAARWCVRKVNHVLYLDWEADKSTHARRLWRLCAGLHLDIPPTGITYRNMGGRPLHTAVQSIATEIDRLEVDLLIIDSLGMACAGEPEKAGDNIRALGAVAGTPCTRLVLTHVNAATASAENGPGRPYGSVYVQNIARSTIEARSEPQGDGRVLVSYYHRKANDTERAPAGALVWSFDRRPDGPLTIQPAEPDLAHSKLPDRILASLRGGGKTVATISDDCHASDSTVRSALARLQKRGIVIQLFDSKGGRSVKGEWGLADRKRGNDEN